jgi:hypothetical protein
MFKITIFILISLISFNSFAVNDTVDTEDGYNWGKYDKKQYKWLGDIQNSFGTSDIVKLNCNKTNLFSCKLVCNDNTYEKIDLIFIGKDELGSRVITFYKNNGIFEMIQTQDTCHYSNFIPMIEYSYDGDV